jgi:hypothetical protein
MVHAVALDVVAQLRGHCVALGGELIAYTALCTSASPRMVIARARATSTRNESRVCCVGEGSSTPSAACRFATTEIDSFLLGERCSRTCAPGMHEPAARVLHQPIAQRRHQLLRTDHCALLW